MLRLPVENQRHEPVVKASLGLPPDNNCCLSSLLHTISIIFIDLIAFIVYHHQSRNPHRHIGISSTAGQGEGTAYLLISAREKPPASRHQASQRVEPSLKQLFHFFSSGKFSTVSHHLKTYILPS